METFWNYVILSNTIKDWFIALGIMAGAMILLRLFQALIVKKLKSISDRTQTTIDDFIITAIQSSVMPLLYVTTVYFALHYLTFPANVKTVLRIAILVVITFFLLRILTSFVAYIFRQGLARRDENGQREKQSKGILIIIQVIIWLTGFLFLIDNLGYDITTLVAGLGIGGIAIALAAQTILGDLFSYLVIFFDKPFEIGDFIIVDDKMGTVEYIGIKTTRIRTLGGEQLICSNTDLTNSRVHNYKRMERRRVVFSFGVIYQTAPEKLKEIPLLVKQIIASQQDTLFDRAHFKAFGDFSLDFEVVYYVLSADYNIYMDKQQAINLAIFEQFHYKGIEFAYPTQTIVFDNNSADNLKLTS